MGFVLAFATLLGGLAALWFFWDKILKLSRRTWRGPTHRRVEMPETKWVDLKYPSDSDLQQQLEAEGYMVRWCTDDNLARKLDLEGWELAIQELEDGRKAILKVKDRVRDQTLIKKQKS
ncbi:hypothetical protein MYX19_05255 [Nitrospinae bacterium AH-259-F20]|nr:hypothetical protein [Nitrospinae bacterium AH-259-F20]